MLTELILRPVADFPVGKQMGRSKAPSSAPARERSAVLPKHARLAWRQAEKAGT